MRSTYRFFLATLILILVLILIGHDMGRLILAQDQPTSTPNVNWVNVEPGINVRSGPGYGYGLVGRLRYGSWVQPLARSLGGEWILITYLTIQGWVQRDGVSWQLDTDSLPVIWEANPTPIPPPAHYNTPGGPTYTPNTNWVRSLEGAYVRAGPGEWYILVGSLFTGDVVDPVAQSVNGDWIMIRLEDGYGWIRADLVAWTVNTDRLAVVDRAALTVDPSVTLASPTILFTETLTATGTQQRVTTTPGLTETPTYTATEPPSSTPTELPTQTPTVTPTPVPPSLTSTPTNEPSATPTNTATATATDRPTLTNTPTAMLTPTQTPMATLTDTPTATATPTDTPSNTPSPTDTLTPTERPTVAVVVVPTDTPIPPSPTRTPSATPTASPTATRTPTLTATATLTATPTATITASHTSTSTASPTETSTPTRTATPTAEPSLTPTPRPTNTASRTATETPAPTDTALPPPLTASPTATLTPLAVAAVDSPGDQSGPAESAGPPAVLEPDGPNNWIGWLAGGAVLLAVVYAGVYLVQAASVNRVGPEFMLDICPVCEAGRLHLDARRYRVAGILRVRRVVRCDNCRSILRDIGRQRWRYAVDRAANPALYDQLNGHVVTEQQLLQISPEQPPRYIEDDEIT